MDDISKLHSKDKSSRWWVFTINNYTARDIEQLAALCGDVDYLTYGYEKGKEEGTPHLQGYLELPKGSRGGQKFSWLKKRLPRAYIAQRKGSRTQARDYCHKECDNPFEYGTWIPDKQGMRNDLICVKRKIDEGCTELDIAEEHFETWTRNFRAFNRYRLLKSKRKCTQKKVYWFYGPTQTGKSEKAMEMAPYAFWKMSANRWFDGYDGESDAVFDDFREDWFPFSYLLRLLDRYPLMVETKGGCVAWTPTRVIITSCYHPQAVYHMNPEAVDQLLRRIDVIEKFEKVSG